MYFSQPNETNYVLKKYGSDIAVTFATDVFAGDGVTFNTEADPVNYIPPLLIKGKLTNIGNVGNNANASTIAGTKGKLLFHYVSNDQVAGQEPVYGQTVSGGYFAPYYSVSVGTSDQENLKLVPYNRDFTLEFFTYIGSQFNGASLGLFGYGNPVSDYASFTIGTNDGPIKFKWATGAAANFYNPFELSFGVDIAEVKETNTYNHFAVSRKNGVLRTFYNGILTDTNTGIQAAANLNYEVQGSSIFSIGQAAGYNDSPYSNVRFSNFRYIIGQGYQEVNRPTSLPLGIVNGTGTRLLFIGEGATDSNRVPNSSSVNIGVPESGDSYISYGSGAIINPRASSPYD